jgi:hypothetical protein
LERLIWSWLAYLVLFGEIYLALFGERERELACSDLDARCWSGMHWFGIGFWHRFIVFALFGFDLVLVVLPPVWFSACFISGFEFLLG